MIILTLIKVLIAIALTGLVYIVFKTLNIELTMWILLFVLFYNTVDINFELVK